MDKHYYQDYALCRMELSDIRGIDFDPIFETISDLVFMRISGMSNYPKKVGKRNMTGYTEDIMSGMVKEGLPLVYLIKGTKKGIEIYVGTSSVFIDSLQAGYEAVFPGINIEKTESDLMEELSGRFGGFFTGIPTDKSGQDSITSGTETICRGMKNTEFTYLLTARGIAGEDVNYWHNVILGEMDKVYGGINRTVTRGNQNNINETQRYHINQNYYDDLQMLESSLKSGISVGMWRVCGYFACNTPADTVRLENIIKTSFSGEKSAPDPFRIIMYSRISKAVTAVCMMDDMMDGAKDHPLGTVAAEKSIEPYCRRFSTMLTSSQLAVMCGLPSVEFPGFYLDEYVEFDTADRVSSSLKDPIYIGEICTAGRTDNIGGYNKYLFERNDLTRHTLVIGITGGGKTNTSKSLLTTLWNSEPRIPFMVIESAKREYWEMSNLRGFEDLIVFTLGAEAAETSVKYRINPFETVKGISLQTHIDNLLATFKAAFELYPPMPYVLEEAVYEVYTDKGWDITENKNRYGFTEYPSLIDLDRKIDTVVERKGYHKEVESNVKAALHARLSSLMIGGKGAMLNTRRSVPIGELLSRPVILELEDIGDDETKSFVIGILLVQLYEYRKTQMTAGSRSLQHILMVEEAHRLLKNVLSGGEGSGTTAKAVEFFCNLLAEIRTFGQGIMIADQIPVKLAPDTIKNTNLKIVHRTVSGEDRETMGRAMNMTEEQINYLSSLRRGYAAVYAEGDEHPKCVKLPLVVPAYSYDRASVIASSQKKAESISSGYDKSVFHHAGCAFCENRCADYYKNVFEPSLGVINYIVLLNELKNKKFALCSMYTFAMKFLQKMNVQKDLSSQICLVGQTIELYKDFSESKKREYVAKYIKYAVEHSEK